MLYLDDMVVGSRATFGDYHVTRDEVLAFAHQYDPQPFHLSDEAAARTHFGRVSASGWHTGAMSMAVIVRYLTAHPQAGLGSPGLDELRWPTPVYPGDTLSVASEIIEARRSRSKPDLGSLHSAITVTNQHGETVMTYRSIVLMRRRPAG